MRALLVLAVALATASSPAGEERSPFQPLTLPGLHNLYQIGPKLFTGSEPQGAEGFASLAALGVRTVIRVDSGKSALELARQQGLRYIHIPVGYDGIPAEAAAALVKALRDTPGGHYIHCHHGEHRGPAMAAVGLKLVRGCDASLGHALMKRMGTSLEYQGLWAAVDTLELADIVGKEPELHEVAPVNGIAAAMTEIDGIADRLKACAGHDWQTPPEHPDVVAKQEAARMMELYRVLEQSAPEEMKALFRENAAAALALAQALEPAQPALASQHWKALTGSCKHCHKSHRN